MALAGGTWDAEFFVDATAQIAGLSTLNGGMLELIGKLWLVSGGKTKMRELPGKSKSNKSSSSINDIAIRKLQVVYIRNSSDLVAHRDTPTIFIPTKPNQESFDVIIWDPTN
jgi:hypothetical protein